MKKTYLIVLGILLGALLSNLLYRGIYGGDSRIAWQQAEYFSGNSAPVKHLNDFPPLYGLSIALAFKLMDRNLLALHFFPLLASLAIPLLFYVICRRRFTSERFALGGTLLFIAYPTALYYININLAEPLAIFCLLLLWWYWEHYQGQWSRAGVLVLLWGLCLLSAYDTILIMAVLLVELVVRKGWQVYRDPLVILFMVLGAVLAVCFAMHASFLPWQKVATHILDPLQRATWPSLPKLGIIVVYIFGVIWLPLFLMGAWQAFQQRREVAPFLFVMLLIVYEVSFYLPEYLKVHLILRHLSLGLPFLCLLGLEGLHWILPQIKRPVGQVALWASLILVAAAIMGRCYFLVQMTHFPTNIYQLVRTNPDLSCYVRSRKLWSDYPIREELIKKVAGHYRPYDLYKCRGYLFDYVYYRFFGERQAHGRRYCHPTITGDLLVAGNYLGAPAGHHGSLHLSFDFPRKIKTLTLAVTMIHWNPNDDVQIWLGPQKLALHRIYWAQRHFTRLCWDYISQPQDNLQQHVQVEVRFKAGQQGWLLHDHRRASIKSIAVAVCFVKPVEQEK